MKGYSFLNISNNSLLHIATHLFTQTVSCSSAKFTTGDFEFMVCLKKFTLRYLEEFSRPRLSYSPLHPRFAGFKPGRD